MAKHGTPAKKGKSLKTLLTVLFVLTLLTGAAVGGLYLWKTYGGDEINVYPVENLSMDYAWATEAQTDGRVTTDKIQSVYISGTQQITEIYVEEGQTVSMGDPILAFDTTLSQLELDRQEIAVAQLELDLQKAKDHLAEIDTYKVGSPPVISYAPITGALVYPAAIPCYQKGIGTAEDPMVYLWNDNCAYDSTFILELAALSAQLKAEQEAPTPEVPETTAPPAEDPTPAPETMETPDSAESPAPEGGESSPAPESTEAPDGETAPPSDPSDPPAEEDPVPPEEPEDPRVYVVFEVRESDALNGVILRFWELAILVGEDGSWIFQVVEPAYEPEADNLIEPDYSGTVDTSIYYTAAEIAKMKAETKQQIIDLTLQLKMAELEYDRLSYELSSGMVYSTVDGVVKTVRDPETARVENQPVVLVSGGGGYYVTAALSEMELDTMQVGAKVTVQSWENYSELEGEIVEISEYPDETGQYWYYSEGNQNISLYPFTVFLDESAALREGEWVTVTYDPGGEDSGGFYVEIPFVLQENGRSYVYAAGENDRLEKRLLTTGGNLWGSYIKVLDGLTVEDHIAFPYGRSVKEGAKLRYAEIDELYAY